MNGTTNRYLKFKDYFGVFCGIPGFTIMNMFMNTFLMIFLTDAMGMNAGILGTIMLVARFIDGATDLGFGVILNNTRSKHGRAKVWLMRIGAPMLLSALLLFFVPSGATAASYVYFTVFYIVYNCICYTVVDMASQAFFTRMTKNPAERATVGVVGMIPQMGLGIVLGFVATALAQTLGWRVLATALTVIAAVFYVLCMVICKELPESELFDGIEENENAPREKFSLSSLKAMLSNVAGNRFVWYLAAYTLIFAISSNIFNSYGTYYATYVMGDASLLGLITLCTLLPMILVLLVTPKLISKFGVYKLTSRGFAIAVIASIGMFVFAWLRQPMLMLVFMVIRGLTSGSMTGAIYAIDGNIIQYSAVKDGKDITGSLFALTTLAAKIGTGLCSFIGGWLLELGKYDGTLTVQPDSAITAIIFIFAGVPLICYILQAICVWKLNPEAATAKLQENK